MTLSTTAPFALDAASSSGKYRLIASALRQRIVRGDWPAGTRLPTRAVLERRFQASSPTVQRALTELTQDGFVQARGRAGTFVRADGPHLRRFGIALPLPEFTSRSMLAQAFEVEARRLELAGEAVVSIYLDVPNPDAPGRKALEEDLAADRLAGVLFAAISIRSLADNLLQVNPRVPLAAMSGDRVPGVISLKVRSYLESAVQRVRAEGRKRAAIIAAAMQGPMAGRWQNLLARHGMHFDPYWAVSVHPGDPAAAQRTAYLMMCLPPDQRPDSIVITDDYLVEPVTRGLRDAGVHLAQDLLVLAHTNFPLPSLNHVPVVRIGLDTAVVLRRAIDALRRRRAGDMATDQEIVLEPVLEEGLSVSMPLLGAPGASAALVE